MSSELEIRPDDHVQGSLHASITLLEYGDYQCPACGEAFPAIREAQEALGPDLRFVFRNLPLTGIHPSALSAAQAAEAAALQEKFWEMHDALYVNQEELSPELYLLLARRLGLDLPRFVHELSGTRVLRHIERDLRGAEPLGLQGTPSFFINGQPYRGAFDGGSLTLALEHFLGDGAQPPAPG